MSFPLLVLYLHAFSTAAMTGLIWFVQVVHYPLFARVGTDEFTTYENLHANLTTYVVAPLMLVELGTAAWLAFVDRPASVPAWMAYAGLALVLLLWLSTFAIQVPQHAVLSRGFDPRAHAILVSTNWIRTVAWSARAVLAFAMIHLAFKGG